MIEQQLYVRGTTKEETGFLGEVPASEFITGDALAIAIGLTAGVAQHSNEPWLKFVDPLDGLTKYVSKKPYRHTISWSHLWAVNAMRGNRTVVINGETYKVRLLKGANSDPIVGSGSGYDLPVTHGSEWNRLMYRINARVGVSAEGITFGEWAQYTDNELVTHSSGGNGSYSLCQEAQGSNRSSRGGAGVHYATLNPATFAPAYHGWRPCLELVE